MYQLFNQNYPYYHFKKATNKSKGIIFFIHGYAVNSDYHNYFANQVNDYDYYAIEHAGHGITPLNNKKQLAPWSYANEVVELIKKLDLKDINLIGHSMGGGIAVLVSQMIPERIKKMVIVTPMNSKGTTKVFNFLFKMNPTKASQLTTYYDILLGDINKMDNIPENEINALLKNQKEYKKNYKVLKRNMASIKNMRILSKNEKDLKVKTMLIVGENDDCINAKTTKKNFMKKNNENILKVITLKQCGHLPFFEFQKEYYNLIMDFFNE